MGKKNVLTFGKPQRSSPFITEDRMLSAFCPSIYFENLQGARRVPAVGERGLLSMSLGLPKSFLD